MSFAQGFAVRNFSTRLLFALVVSLLLAGPIATPAFAADDSYLLALTWQPGFCVTGNHGRLAECMQAKGVAPRFTLHGLWPDWDINGDGKRNAADAFCLQGDSGRKAILDAESASAKSSNWLALPEVSLTPASRHDLTGVMPATVSGLERHEWWKHGTCSGLQPDDYFATAILLVRQVERAGFAKMAVSQAGKTVGRNQLLQAFEADFGKNSGRALQLDCTRIGGESVLMEIRIRLRRASIAQGLSPENLAIPAKAAKGDCAATLRIPGGTS